MNRYLKNVLIYLIFAIGFYFAGTFLGNIWQLIGKICATLALIMIVFNIIQYTEKQDKNTNK